MAIFIPRIWLSILLATAKPAASSAAELILRPDDKRSMAFVTLLSALTAYVRACNAPTFVLITVIFHSCLRLQAPL